LQSGDKYNTIKRNDQNFILRSGFISMLLSPEIMRSLLLLCLLGMTLLAGLFLRGRSLSFSAYLGWGLLTILLPLLGPFLVILLHPGSRRN
jgi:hypothetical protein